MPRPPGVRRAGPRGPVRPSVESAPAGPVRSGDGRRSPDPSGPSGRSRSASHASRTPWTSRMRAASAAAFVAAIPAPIATSPRASRVMSRHPPAVRAGTNGRSAASASVGSLPPATACDQGRGEHEGQVAGPGDGRIMGLGGHRERHGATRSREPFDASRPNLRRLVRADRRPMAVRRTDPRSLPRIRPSRVRPSGGRRRTGDRPPRPGRRWSPWCWRHP